MSEAVRLASESDAGALLALRRKLFAESNTMLWEPQEFNFTEEDERRRIKQLLEAPNCTYLVAESDGQLVGLLFAAGAALNRLRQSTTLVVGVSKEHQGRGIATRLVTEALLWSKVVGLKRVELTVHTTNLRAVGVYLRCGFVVEGVRRASLLVDGVYVNEYLMSVVHGDA